MAVITISRQGGAGGWSVAHPLSQRLGYTLIDEDIVHMVAKDIKVTAKWVRSVEKDAGGLLHRVIDGLISKKYIDRHVGEEKGYIDEKVYIEALYKVITRVAKEDNCVILGRGGQYILKDFDNTYHVLLIAAKQDRINFMVEHHKFLPTEAKNIVERYDVRRARLYRKLGGTDYDKPELYHLLINTSKLKVERATDIIADLVST